MQGENSRRVQDPPTGRQSVREHGGSKARFPEDMAIAYFYELA